MSRVAGQARCRSRKFNPADSRGEAESAHHDPLRMIIPLADHGGLWNLKARAAVQGGGLPSWLFAVEECLRCVTTVCTESLPDLQRSETNWSRRNSRSPVASLRSENQM